MPRKRLVLFLKLLSTKTVLRINLKAIKNLARVESMKLQQYNNINVLITATIHSSIVPKIGELCSVDFMQDISYEELGAIIHKYDIIITATRLKFDESVLIKAANLKLIIRLGIGVDHIDLKTCQKQNIAVCITPNANTMPVVELVFSQLIRFLRKIDLSERNLYNGDFRNNLQHGASLLGKNIGIIGVGRIGSKIAEVSRYFGMNALCCDPYIDTDKKLKLNFCNWTTIEEIVKKSDIITLHVPLTNETKYLINKNLIINTNRKPLIVNTSRGAVVRFDDIIDMVESEVILGFIADVYENEPRKPVIPHRIRDKFLLTPHIGAYTKDALLKRSEEALEQVRAFCTNSPVKSIIDFDKGY